MVYKFSNSLKTYELLHEGSGIEVGDRVKILRKAENKEFGWQEIWISKMNNTVGCDGTVISDNGEYGFEVEMENGEVWEYPCFVLGIIEKANAID